MIIDGHAYCYPPLGQANGYASEKEHLRYIQRMMAGHRQPAWRVRDRGPGDSNMLADPKDPTVRGNREVNFRAGGYGRFVWTIDGDDYAKQYLPPYMIDLSCPPELLIAQMDYAGIDVAVLHAHPIMGLLNDYLADCVNKYPNRLLGLASVPEWKIDEAPERWAAEVKRAYGKGLHGFQFIADSRYRHGVQMSWDADACRPFWDAVVALGKPILFTLHSGPTLEEHLEQLRIWSRWLMRYPDASAVHTHGFPWQHLRDGDRLRLPDTLLEPFRTSSAKLELLFPISVGHIWDYPYKEVRPTIVELIRTLGADRLIWGTDMPNVERYCNYRQNLDMFRVHCKGEVAAMDLDGLLGRTCADLFGLTYPR